MKNMLLLLLLGVTLVLPSFGADAPAPVGLVSVIAPSDHPLTIGELVRYEIANTAQALEAAAPSYVGGVAVVTFTSSSDFGGVVFTDGSFIRLPQKVPYTSEGRELSIHTDDLSAPNAPLSLIAAANPRVQLE